MLMCWCDSGYSPVPSRRGGGDRRVQPAPQQISQRRGRCGDAAACARPGKRSRTPPVEDRERRRQDQSGSRDARHDRSSHLPRSQRRSSGCSPSTPSKDPFAGRGGAGGVGGSGARERPSASHRGTRRRVPPAGRAPSVGGAAGSAVRRPQGVEAALPPPPPLSPSPLQQKAAADGSKRRSVAEYNVLMQYTNMPNTLQKLSEPAAADAAQSEPMGNTQSAERESSKPAARSAFGQGAQLSFPQPAAAALKKPQQPGSSLPGFSGRAGAAAAAVTAKMQSKEPSLAAEGDSPKGAEAPESPALLIQPNVLPSSRPIRKQSSANDSLLGHAHSCASTPTADVAARAYRPPHVKLEQGEAAQPSPAEALASACAAAQADAASRRAAAVPEVSAAEAPGPPAPAVVAPASTTIAPAAASAPETPHAGASTACGYDAPPPRSMTAIEGHLAQAAHLRAQAQV